MIDRHRISHRTARSRHPLGPTQAIDKHVDPPMVAHPQLRNQRTSLLPGDVTYASRK